LYKEGATSHPELIAEFEAQQRDEDERRQLAEFNAQFSIHRRTIGYKT
jgi:hypothetical protein